MTHISFPFISPSREAPPGELDDLELRDLQSKVPWAHLNQLHQDPAQKGQLDYTEVECVVNDEYTVSCRKEGSEVYLPFSFLSKYFEVCIFRAFVTRVMSDSF